MRSLSAGARPSPITITRYTSTTTAVSPVADTVWTSSRSTRRAIRGLVPAARASGHERRRAGGDLGGVGGPVDQDAQRRHHEGDLDDDGHRAADQLQPLAGDARPSAW